MRVSIVGSGYVGLVSGAGLAQVGHNVICMDIDPDRVALLRNGQSPIFEPGLEKLLRENAEQGRLQFTTDMQKAVDHAEVAIIAVGTPPQEDGSADLGHVLAVARASGITVDAGKVNDNVRHAIVAHRGHKPSMLQDVLAGRLTEIESINGAVVATARRHGVPVPHTETLMQLVRLVQVQAQAAHQQER